MSDTDDQLAVALAARELFESDTLEVDDDAKVSWTEGGVWVQAWLWIPDEDLAERGISNAGADAWYKEITNGD